MVAKDTTNTLLMDHAAGTLPAMLDVMVASYIEVNAEAAVKARTFDAVGGLLLDEIKAEEAPGSAPAADALDIIFERITDGDNRTTRPAAPPNGEAGPAFDSRTRRVVPAALRSYLPASLDQLKWRRLGGGVKEYMIDVQDSGLKASLLWIDPGRAVPHHSHRGREYTLLLEGAYDDVSGRVEAGDFVVNDMMDVHKPTADSAMGCLCFAITDAPIRLRGPLGWVFNAFIK